MSVQPLSTDDLLIHLLASHRSNVDPSPYFLQSNAAGLEILWGQELSCWHITRLVAGNIRPRHVYKGSLTPKGIIVAEHVSSRNS
jgi:hypothetical protein